MLVRDGDMEGREEGERVKVRPRRPRRPWTAARKIEVLRQCSLAIAQQLLYYAIAVSYFVLYV